MQDSIAEGLVGKPADQYGATHTADLLDQYKLYVEMADRISQRRQIANTFFLTVSTALVSFMGVTFPSGTEVRELAWYIIVGLAGVILALTWYRLIRSYRDLNAVKFGVIQEIEAFLPLMPYKAEWEAVGRGDEPKLYLPFTHIETRVPWIFMVLYVALAVTSYLG